MQLKKLTYGDSMAVMILVGQRLGVTAVHVDDAVKQLNGVSVYPMTAAAMEKEAVRLNNSLAHDEEAIKKANLIAEVVKEEYGFDTLKRLYGASSSFYAGTSYGRAVTGASSMVREFAVKDVTSRSYVVELGMKVNRKSMTMNTSCFVVDMFKTIEEAQAHLRGISV
jgi:hypothetical protein